MAITKREMAAKNRRLLRVLKLVSSNLESMMHADAHGYYVRTWMPCKRVVDSAIREGKCHAR